MPAYPWLPLLKQWSHDVLASAEFAQPLTPEVRATGWLGYPPATPAQLAAAEARLGHTLPPSYRAFLVVSNGWHMVGIPTVTRLLPVEQTEWMARQHPEWIEEWLAGYRAAYAWSGEIDPVELLDENGLPLEHLRETLAVSDGEDEIFLLNPQVVSAAGEWEAWVFDVEAGISRYPSFWALMEAEYDTLRDLMAHAAARLGPSATAEETAASLSLLVAELGERAEQFLQLARRNLLAAGYEAGIASALVEALKRVTAIQKESLPPPVVRQRLDALADELDHEWQAGARSTGTGSIRSRLQVHGKAEGYRQAMGLIRSFREER